MDFTPQQQRAIREQGNLLVAAAAGSGKTAVLTERIVALVREGADLEKMLVVTFTNAAADEMRKRIQSALLRAAQEAENPQDAKRLHEQAQKTGRANISTLHSFCMHVLRRHFHEAELDPAFRLADDIEADVVFGDALDELLEERFEQGDAGFLSLVELTGSEEELISWVEKIYEFMRAQPEPIQWLKRAVAQYGLDAAGIERSLPAQIRLLDARDDARYYAESMQQTLDEEDSPAVRIVLSDELTRARALALSKTERDYRARLNAFEFGRLTFPRDYGEARKTQIKAQRDAFKKLLRERHARLFSRSPGEEAALLARLLPALYALTSLIADFDALYFRRKGEEGFVDFADLEHLTLRTLSNPVIAEEYRKKFDHIFVDEYQDTNRVQEAVLARIRRENNLFLVGDVKQSIYRFRLADPGLFLEKHRDYGRGEGGKRIDLNTNFRSARAVIDAVNDVFGSIMSERLGEIDYGEDERLRMGRCEGDGAVELHLIERAPEPFAEEDADAEGGATEAMEAAELEALLAAQRIREIMQGEKLFDAKLNAQRDYRYGDFAVLLRSTRNTALTYTQMLALEGIPAYAELTGGYFDAIEVAVFLNLLKLIDNGREDIPLLSILRSPIGGFSIGELTELRLHQPDGSFFEALRALAQADSPLGKKCGAFLERIGRYRADAGLYRLEELIGRLLDDTGYYHFAGALPGGAARRANLDELMNRARAFEQGRSRTLSGFLRFMERAKRNDAYGEAQTAGMDVVRVLSIHKSKGLEFPVVVIGGLAKKFNRSDAASRLAMDEVLGLGVRALFDRRRVDTMYYQVIKAQALKKQLSEEMRVLYVGMTRARERLILIGCEKNLLDMIQKRAAPPDPVRLSQENSFLGWILLALMAGPDGNPLREMLHLPLRGGYGCVEISLHTGLKPPANAGVLSEEAYAAWAQNARQAPTEEIEERFFWRYADEAATLTPSKVSVSALSHPGAPSFAAPAFLEGQVLAPADRGSATHLLFERISLRAHTEQSVREEITTLREKGFLSEAQANAISAPDVAAFFASPLGRRLLGSARTERELEFNILTRASELGPPYSGDENVMLQGVIDCCFMEDDEWVLLDYKTDAVPPGVSPEQAAAKHEKQLALYARSLNRLSGLPVKEGYIHLLSVGASVRVL
ncbi:MAG: helicase-exonuclease AddAB subunit AddA [Bacillota bacterium]